MPKYIVTVDVTARGTQAYRVDAASPEDAIEKVRDGGGDFLDEFLEVEDALDYDAEEDPKG